MQHPSQVAIDPSPVGLVEHLDGKQLEGAAIDAGLRVEEPDGLESSYTDLRKIALRTIVRTSATTFQSMILCSSVHARYIMGHALSHEVLFYFIIFHFIFEVPVTTLATQ